MYVRMAIVVVLSLHVLVVGIVALGHGGVASVTSLKPP